MFPIIKVDRQYREETSQKISWGHWFAFFNIILAILIGSRYAFIIDWPNTLFGKLYFFISLFGHFSFIVFALYLLIVFPLSFLIKNHRTFRGVTVLVATIGISLLLFDTQVFSRFNLHLTSFIWDLLINPENGEISRDWQLFFTPMPLILLAQMLFSRWSWQKIRSLNRQKWGKFVGLFFICAFMATHLIYAWADAAIYRPITMQRSNFPVSYPMTARTFLEKHGLLDKAEYAETLNQQGRPDALELEYPKQSLSFAPLTQKPNILVMTISGLRYDAISRKNMPNLSDFAEDSTYYLNHYSSGNTNNAGLVGLFYGLSANYVDSILNLKHNSVLMDKLKDEKYQFGLFSSNYFQDPILKQALFRQFDLNKANSNESAVKNWQVWFDKNHLSAPWFSYIDLEINEFMPIETLSLEAETRYYEKLTQQIDQLFASVKQKLTENGQLENTLVIVTAEHGYTFQRSMVEKQNLNYFARSEVQVPLIIHWQQLPKQKNYHLTSHLDILPTLMQSVFLTENPISDYSQGKNLLHDKQEDWVSVSNFKWNVIITADGTQYHMDKQGNYQKYDRDYVKLKSNRPPLGLFLAAFNREQSFIKE